ncbi:MAG: hypothetical protein EP335_05675 [Alphaproteobacteria bacterium]|nr:MAG: hypothetical protein EP335_05675 [Alphaproteobacteria bacterium]
MTFTPSRTGRLPFLHRLFDLMATNDDRLAVCNLDSRFQLNPAPAANLTYGMLARQSLAYARTLGSRAEPGSIVLLAEQDHTAFAVSLIACWIAGVIPAPCPAPDSDMHRARLEGIIDATKPSLVLSGADFHTWFSTVETLNHQAGTESVSPEISLKAGLEAALDIAGPGASELAVVQFSSGSVSDPKGIAISFDNIQCAVGEIILGAINTRERVTLVNWLPLFHDMGLFGSLMTPLLSGGTCYGAAPKCFVQRPQAWLAAMARFKATAATLPNFGVEVVNRKLSGIEIPELDLSALTDIFCGAEPLSATSMSSFISNLAPYGLRDDAFRPCYGLAEGTLMVSISQSGHAPSTMPAATARALGLRMPVVNCGFPAAPGRVKILRPDPDTGLADAGQGEICIAGNHVSRGFVGPDGPGNLVSYATIRDSDGVEYVRTRDIGYLDNTGLFVLDRLSNMISVKAQNISLSDIERTMEHWFGREVQASKPANRRSVSCMVINFGDRAASDLLLVAEGLARGVTPAEKEKLQIGAERYLAGYFGIRIPVDLDTTKPLPRTSSGKLQRAKAGLWYQTAKAI